MDENQARVVELLANVFAKLFLAVLAGLAFAAVTVMLLVNPSWPVAVVDVVLTGTVYVVFKHYFPAKG